jgi:hypothetical protein
MIDAYGPCYPNLATHDDRYPKPQQLLERTVAGYDDVEDGVQLIIKAVDSSDSRPVWFCNWGTDAGSAKSCLLRALERVMQERGAEGYAKFKRRIYLSSSNEFAGHTTTIEPPFPIWVDAGAPELQGKRWYHRFSVLTAKAGGFDIERDVRSGHGPLGALYPMNTTFPQKEGDSMYFLYLVPTGMNDPLQPSRGSWGGRYGPQEGFTDKPYYWANQKDTWNGTTDRDNTLARWAVALRHDFAARMDWCITEKFEDANHAPHLMLNNDTSRNIVYLQVQSGDTIELSSTGSNDPDGDAFNLRWYNYPEAGTYDGSLVVEQSDQPSIRFIAPEVASPQTVHIILEAQDHGSPSLHAYRRAVITVMPR